MKNVYIGIDVGTQGLKGVVVGEHGTVWAHAFRNYPTHSPAPGWKEQDPQDWLAASDQVLQELVDIHLPVRFVGVGFTGQMHTTVICDRYGQPLRPAILWSDIRSANYGLALEGMYGTDTLVKITGNKPLSNFSLLRLLWLRDHEATIYSQVRRVAVAKDWLRDQVTQTFFTDVTDASGTYLFDVAHRSWATSWIKEMAMPLDWWGSAVESDVVVGVLKRGPSLLLGLPVIAGAGDQEASAVGTGLVPSHDVGISLGTSGVVFLPRTGFAIPPHPSVHSFCHAVPDTWHWMAVTQAASLSLRWYRDAFAPRASYRELDEMAAESPAGSKGLLFFPYLQGERAPLMNSAAQGTYMGIRPEHMSADFVRAILEGVIFSLYHSWTVMMAEPPKVFERLIATGGGAQSTLWMQILADVFGTEVTVVEDPGAAVGAAWLAFRGIEHHTQNIPLNIRTVCKPSSEVFTYHKKFAEFRTLAERLNALWQCE